MLSLSLGEQLAGLPVTLVQGRANSTLSSALLCDQVTGASKQDTE